MKAALSAAILGFFGRLSSAIPLADAPDELANITAPHNLFARSIDCNNRPSDVTQDHCQHASDIGMAGLGSGTGSVYYGTQGPFVLNFNNAGSQPIMLTVWEGSNGIFVSGNTPAITHSMNPGDWQSVSIASGNSGGFGAMRGDTTLNNAGMLWNTIGEWSTGDYPTFDVSREVNNEGQGLAMYANGAACIAKWIYPDNVCAYRCVSPSADWHSCGTQGSYWLDNCVSQPGSAVSPDLTSGGCQGGWNWINIEFHD